MIENSKKEKDDLLIYLVQTYGKSVKKFAYTYVKDWTLTEDIAQDVFMNCYHHLDNFRNEASYKTWIFTITANKSKDVLKSSWFKQLFRIGDKEPLNKSSSAEELYLAKNAEEQVVQSVMTLPIKYREVIILYYYEDMKIKEMQELLRVNENTIKTRLSRAKGLIRKKLERSGLEWRTSSNS
ncbi:sigma-70 family RNA polymerase sigma factor [Radiobacillus kanasensis]|uniref:sigma-70 family RNA polymerase sigma factor n=1 Tax=Radiobacillus kanasensis TaxID=2844358 RepID=UPI001E5E558E|nr:sigma-70 family RNA polymerase sigma factor [Radiobacillus kanasensis]UFT98436.1 sigma-70 family RNA polymerase sigma factor [Radiobacillus kanasensis]